MENVQQSIGVGMMTLAVSEKADLEFLSRVAEPVRALPQVLRVRVVPERAQLEVMFQQPAPELLRRIHRVLQAARQTDTNGICLA
jgi:hypothetical protein